MVSTRRSHSRVGPREGEDREAVSFDGTRIEWTLYGDETAPTVLIVPGFWRTRSHESIVGYARSLRDAGFVVATMDLRGHGGSEGTFGFNLHEYFDVEAVAREILRITGTDHLMLAGFSYGAAVAISAVAKTDLTADGLFLISPVADFSRIRPSLNPLTIRKHVVPGQAFHAPSFLKDLIGGSPRRSALEDVKEVRCPIHFLHVRDDWLIGHEHSEMLAEAHPGPHELEIVEIEGNFHADHIFHADPGRIEHSSEDFFRRLLDSSTT